MSGLVPNYGAALPKEYRSASHGMNDETDLPKLFRGIILGSSGSGKSNLLIDFLKKSPNVYTHLHLVARQPEQPLYLYLKDKLEDFCTIYGADDPPRVDDIKKEGLQLVVFDDFSNDQKWCAAHVVPFFIRGRHRGCSVLFLSHSFHAGTPKMARLNSEVLMILKSPSKSDMKSVLRDMPIAGVNIDELWKMYSEVQKKRGQLLMIDTLSQTIRYNWKTILFDGMKQKNED